MHFSQVGIPYQLSAVIAILLFLAILPMPYGYYTFTKIAVFGCAATIAYLQVTAELKGAWPYIWATIAIVFNPLLEIQMTKEVWMALDTAIGLLFSYSAYRGLKNLPLS